MRKAVAVAIVLIFLCSLSYAESKKKRIKSLEKRITAIEEELRNMTEVSETVDKNVEFYVDDEAPATGEGKVVYGTLLALDDCDATTQWAVQSGVGVAIALDTTSPHEGTGSIKITIPAGITAIVTATKTSGSWDLSTYPLVLFSLKRSSNLTSYSGLTAYLGETVYSELSVSPAALLTVWARYAWDISGVAAASKNAITMFSFKVKNETAETAYAWVDWVFAAPGYGKFQAGYFERTATLSPPYSFTYTATATDPRTITIPRAGTIKALLIAGDEGVSGAYFATADMSGKAKLLSATAVLATGQITSMGDGTFTVSGNLNNNGTTYYGLAFFED